MVPGFVAPDVYASLHYRAWLVEACDAVRRLDPTLTHRRLAARLGYKSSGAVALLLSGTRRLSVEAARRVGVAFGLDREAVEHLVLLVRYEQATHPDQRAVLLDEMMSQREFARLWRDALWSHELYRHWTRVALRELVSLPQFVEDPAWIAANVVPTISVAEAAEALTALVAHGLLVRDPHGRLQPRDAIIATPLEIRSDLLKRHQHHMLTLAAHALNQQPAKVRDMRVMTVAISRAQADRIKQRLGEVHREILAIVAEDEPIEAVFQLNTQWFALSASGLDGATTGDLPTAP